MLETVEDGLITHHFISCKDKVSFMKQYIRTEGKTVEVVSHSKSHVFS